MTLFWKKDIVLHPRRELYRASDEGLRVSPRLDAETLSAI